MATVQLESSLDQNGQDNQFIQNEAFFRTRLRRWREDYLDQNGPFRSDLAKRGPLWKTEVLSEQVLGFLALVQLDMQALESKRNI